MNETEDTTYQSLQILNQRFANLMLPAMGLLGILMGIGVIGNLLVLYIYQNKLKHNTTRSFVLALAVFDLISCTVAMPGEIVDMLQNYTFGNSPGCKMIRTLNSFSAFASGMILFVVAIDRYKKICSPLGKQVSTRMANIIILICFFISLLLSAPAVFLYGKRTVSTKNPLITGADCSTEDRFQGTLLPILYNSLQFCVFTIGALGLSILYFLIGKRIWRHRRFERKGLKVRSSAKSSVSCSDSSPNSTEAASSPHYIYPNNRGEPRFFNDPHDDCSKHIYFSRCSSKPYTPGKMADERSDSFVWPVCDKDAAMNCNNKANNGQKPEQKPEQNNTVGHNKRISIFGFGGDSSGEKIHQTYPRCSARQEPEKKRKRNPTDTTRNVSKRSFDRRSSTVTGAARRESNARKTTLMLFLITVVYILSFLPHLVLMAAKALDKNSLSGTGGGRELAHNILLRSYFINSVANPIVYGFCCQKFRSEIVKLLTCKSCR